MSFETVFSRIGIACGTFVVRDARTQPSRRSARDGGLVLISDEQRYGLVSRLLHWTVVVLFKGAADRRLRRATHDHDWR